MANITLNQINNNILTLKREVDDIKGLLEESNMELSDKVKTEIEKSRKRNIFEFKTQEEMEKKFL